MKTLLFHEASLLSRESEHSFLAVMLPSEILPEQQRNAEQACIAIDLERGQETDPSRIALQLSILLSPSISVSEKWKLLRRPLDMQPPPEDLSFAETVSFSRIILLQPVDGSTQLESIAYLATTARGVDGSAVCPVRYRSLVLFMICVSAGLVLCGNAHDMKTALSEGLYSEFVAWLTGKAAEPNIRQ